MSTDDDVTRPCAHCGKPVPQRSAAGRPFRYCRDNDGACQAAARNSRLRHRNSPGLAGQVAKAYEMVDRLEQVVDTLTDALAEELSPAGVERQLAAVRAEAAAQVSSAQNERDTEIGRFVAERDEARHDADRAARLARTATEAAEAARAHAEATREAADAQIAESLEQAQRAAQVATRATEAQKAAVSERDAAQRDATTAEALRAEAYRDRELARAAAEETGRELEALRGDHARAGQELTAVRETLTQREGEVAAARAAQAHATQELQRVQEAARVEQVRLREERDAELARQRAERDTELTRLRSEQDRQLASVISERDTARAEAAGLRARVDELTGQVGQLAATLTALSARLDQPAPPTQSAPTPRR